MSALAWNLKTNKRQSRRLELKCQEKIHNEEKPKTKQYEMIHIGEKPFACSLCDRKVMAHSKAKQYEMNEKNLIL